MAPNHQFDEKNLLKRIAEGNAEAFRQLFDKYSDRIFSTAFLLTKSADLAEDMVQEVFTRIWTGRSHLDIVQNIDAWLYTIARNLIFERLRKEARADKYRQYVKDYFSESPLSPDKEAEFRELDKTIRAAILQLPPQLQKAFLLSRDKGLNHAEIAQEMGISRGTVKSYIVQSIVVLRKVLSGYRSSIWIGLCIEYFL